MPIIIVKYPLRTGTALPSNVVKKHMPWALTKNNFGGSIHVCTDDTNNFW